MIIKDDRPIRPPFYRTTPPVVLALAAVIISASLIQLYTTQAIEGAMLNSGALVDLNQYPGLEQKFGPFAPYILHVFLHIAWWHLGMNMWALISFGALPSLALGKTWRGGTAFLAFFFVCAIGGALSQVALFQIQAETAYSIGASTAISGLLPAVGYVQGGWKRAVQISVPWFLVNIGLAVFGSFSPIAVGWAAHLGGLAAGFTYPVFLKWARA